MEGEGVKVLNSKEIIPARYVSPDKDIVEYEDYQDMCEVLHEDNVIDLQKKLILHILWDTGMRVSELVEIDLSDLQNRKSKEESFTLKVRSRKSMRYNLVVWGKKTEKILNKYLGIRLTRSVTTDALFIPWQRYNDQRLSTRTVQRWIREICDLAMIDKRITPHSFRHGKAHQMLDLGANIRDVQVILRHVKPENSFHYLTVHPDRYILDRYIKIAQKYLKPA